MADTDYYEVLGVPRDASQEEIKRAYKRMARRYHPDVAENKHEAEVKFRQINEAYSVLSDAEKRAYYDRFGRAPGTAPTGAGGGFTGFGDFGFPFGDLFETLFDMTGTGRARGPRPTRGDDLRVHLRITLEEAFTGVEKEVSYEVETTCPTCQGRRTTEADGLETCRTCGGAGQVQRLLRTGFGSISQVGPCPECRGQGRILRKPCPQCQGRAVVQTRKTLTVRVPPGIEHGQSLRISGAGEAGAYGGPPGDLYVTLAVEEHPEFRRVGDDLVRVQKITFSEAALGAEIEVPTLGGGKERLKIPPGTQHGTIFRFKGKGMPRLQRSGRGDLLVEVHVMVPTRLNARQKKLLAEFAQAGSQEAHEDHGLLGKIRDALLG
jgi:molecular chaperone DnaJ